MTGMKGVSVLEPGIRDWDCAGPAGPNTKVTGADGFHAHAGGSRWSDIEAHGTKKGHGD